MIATLLVLTEYSRTTKNKKGCKVELCFSAERRENHRQKTLTYTPKLAEVYE